MLKFNIIGIFNNLIENYFSQGVVGRAVEQNLLNIDYIHLRDFTTDVHQSVDDKPFGGSDGMLMSYGPLEKALNHVGESKVIYLSPRGKVFNSEMAKQWSQSKTPITLISGRYAGVDERLIQSRVDEEVSIGDFVLSGGEIAAMAVIDSVARFVPGVLGSKHSSEKDSFSNVLLEGPQFTRPQSVTGLNVPEVLTSGHHLKIDEFNKALSVLTTLKLRPDLIQSALTKKIITKQNIKQAFDYLNALTANEQQSCGFNQEQLTLTKKHWEQIT
ncbi:MAG: tRNA (guanosine(37)-N1)-methyltransferase TrmD [Bdellovibrionales bacterium]|nr:tRNA (guanosine(37)-N1)-methyltransferase TrmD [Bdellovibrionales bacterium]